MQQNAEQTPENRCYGGSCCASTRIYVFFSSPTVGFDRFCMLLSPHAWGYPAPSDLLHEEHVHLEKVLNISAEVLMLLGSHLTSEG